MSAGSNYLWAMHNKEKRERLAREASMVAAAAETIPLDEDGECAKCHGDGYVIVHFGMPEPEPDEEWACDVCRCRFEPKRDDRPLWEYPEVVF